MISVGGRLFHGVRPSCSGHREFHCAQKISHSRTEEEFASTTLPVDPKNVTNMLLEVWWHTRLRISEMRDTGPLTHGLQNPCPQITNAQPLGRAFVRGVLAWFILVLHLGRHPSADFQLCVAGCCHQAVPRTAHTCGPQLRHRWFARA